MRLPTKPGPGVYRKYLVKRLRDREKKHAHCEFFVLDQMHDPFAIPALNAYADACEATHPDLAADLRTKVAAMHGRIASGSMRSPYEPDATAADSSSNEPEDEQINAAHPLKTGRHDLYANAMRLVGARHAKGDLVDLVNWLLYERVKLESVISETVLNTIRLGNPCPFCLARTDNVWPYVTHFKHCVARPLMTANEMEGRLK